MPVKYQSWIPLTGLAAFTIAKKPGLRAKYGAGFPLKTHKKKSGIPTVTYLL